LIDRRWLPPLAWAAVILTLTSIPNPNVPAPKGSDLVVHFGVYGVLGWLLARAARVRGAGHRVALALLVTALGAADERHQQFIPGRFASVDDWVADSAGGTLGLIACVTARKRREPTT